LSYKHGPYTWRGSSRKWLKYRCQIKWGPCISKNTKTCRNMGGLRHQCRCPRCILSIPVNSMWYMFMFCHVVTQCSVADESGFRWSCFVFNFCFN
jgi:hypothetical protein